MRLVVFVGSGKSQKKYIFGLKPVRGGKDGGRTARKEMVPSFDMEWMMFKISDL